MMIINNGRVITVGVSRIQ